MECSDNGTTKRAPAKSFEDLIVWQQAHAFTLQVYAATRNFPRDEIYGITSQLRRAAVSIAANIAEGFRKRTTTDKAGYLNISEGSLDECRYYLILAHDLGLLEKQSLWNLESGILNLESGIWNLESRSGNDREHLVYVFSFGPMRRSQSDTH